MPRTNSPRDYPPARKRFGQHFLEPVWAAKVLRAIDPAGDETFLEIGPGRGAITALLAAVARHVIAFEIDAAVAAGILPAHIVFQTTSSNGAQLERLRIDSKGGEILTEEFANGADPAAPAAGARLYIVKTAGGKDQLAVRFPTGAVQIIATQP